jgi:4-hydroxybenzoate polyprenyltransferase
MLKTIRHLLELIRFSHTLFALPFALLAAVMAWRVTDNQVQLYNYVAESQDRAAQSTPSLAPILDDSGKTIGHRVIPLSENVDSVGYVKPMERASSFHWQQLVGILFCMAFARSAAMAFNRIADRSIDAQNPRTRIRHIPAGILSVGQVTLFAIACSAAFVASTLWFLPNRLPLYLSIPVLLFLLGYSYAKRFTAFAHIWLGAALALSPLAVWIALRGEAMIANPIEFLPPLVLGAAVMSWVSGFDVIYACQDYEFDRQAGLHSIPVALGIRGALRLAAVCHLITIACLAALAFAFPFFSWIYWAGVAAIAALLIYEHALVRPNDLSHVNAAFFNVNAIISLGLFLVGSLDLLLHRVG